MKSLRTALAVVIVVAAGLAVGVVVGGKKETRTVTVTEAGRTVTVGVPAAGSGDTGALDTTTDTTATKPAGSPPPSPNFQPVALSGDLVTIDDTTRSSAANENVSIVNAEYQQQAQLQQGTSKDDSMTFQFDAGCCDNYAADYYQFEVTIPVNATRFVSTMGFVKGAATGNTVKVSFYKNEYVEGEAIRQRALDSADEVAPVNIPVTGLSKLIVRFYCANPGNRWRIPSDNTPRFAFLDAHFE